VTREAYPDPTSKEPGWLTCNFRPVKTLTCPITLTEIKANPALSKLPLIRQSRLAVMPVTPKEFEEILVISSEKG
ncbi:MAG: EVE domain-containing protein, partial [Desulfobacterales bacterium]|nr:EVE domain-containing protein [Desulfobacterales bacterium]